MAERTIKTRFEIAGEQEYTQAIQNCKDKMATLNSEMKLAASQYDGQRNSVEALSRNGELLAQKYDLQKQKVEGLQSALQNMTNAQTAYANDVAAYQDKIDAATKELDAMKNSSEDTEDAQRQLEKQVEELTQEQQKAQLGYERTSESVDKYQRSLNYAKADLNNTNRAIEQNAQYLEEAKNSADGTASSIDGYGKKVASAGDQSSLMGKLGSEAFSKLGQAFTAAGLIAMVQELGQAYIEALDASAKFETSMAKIATIADTSAMTLDSVADEILKVSSRLGVAAEEIAESVYQAISAGVETSQAVQFADTATRLSVGGFTDAATAVDTLTTVLNAYGKNLSETTHISDVLITTQNLGKTSVDELGNSIGKVIPIAAAYEVDLENVSAAYASLTASGIATEEAGTSLKAMLNELGDAGSEVGTILEEQTGKSFLGLMSSGTSLGEVMDILAESVNGNTAAFAQLWSSSEAGTAALSMLNTGADSFNETLAAMSNSTGAAETAYNTMADTAEQASARAQTAWDNLWKTIISPEAKTEWSNFWAGLWTDVNNGIENSQRAADLQAEKQEKLNAVNEEYRAGVLNTAEAQEKINEITEEYGELIDQAYSGEWRIIEANREKADAINKSYDALEDLWEAYDGSASSVENLIAFTKEETEASRQLGLAFEDEIAEIESVKAQMQELEERYAASKAAAYENISATVGAFEMFDATATTSIQSVIAALNSQIAWVNNYSTNMQTVMQIAKDNGITLSAELIAAMTAGTQDAAALTAGLVQAGADGITELNDSYKRLEEGKQTFSTITAEIETDYTQHMSDLEAQYDKAVQNFNQSTEAYNATRDTFMSAANAARAYSNYVGTAYYNAGVNAAAQFRAGLNNNMPSASSAQIGRSASGSATGSAGMPSASSVQRNRSVADSTMEATSTPSSGDTQMNTSMADHAMVGASMPSSGDMRMDTSIVDAAVEAVNMMSASGVQTNTSMADSAMEAIMRVESTAAIRSANEPSVEFIVKNDMTPLETAIGNLERRIANMGIYLDDGTLVGGITDSMDKSLGRRYAASQRGDM